MSFQRPHYLFRATGKLLVALSLDELCELLTCADDAGHEVELIHAYYGREWLPTASELECIASLLWRC
jgi:hypothetical protein